MKRYHETREQAKRAIEQYERKFVDRPAKEELRVHRYGKRYVIATDSEMFYKRVHELPFPRL